MYLPIGVCRPLGDDSGYVVELTVPDIASVLAYAFTTIQVQKAATATGSYSDDVLIPLVAGTSFYSTSSNAYLITTWFRYRFETTNGLVFSPWSPPFPVQTPRNSTRAYLRQETAKGMGFYDSGTTTAAGSTTQVVDSAKSFSVLTTNAWANAWIKMTGGAASGNVRRIAGYEVATGAFTPTPALSDVSGVGAAYELYREVSPDLIDDAVNDALQIVQMTDQTPLTTQANRPRYPLPYWLQDEEDLLAVSQRSGIGATTVERLRERYSPLAKSDYHIESEQGELLLVFHAPPAANAIYRLTYRRAIVPHPDLKLTADADTVNVHLKQLDAIKTLAAVKVCERVIQGARTNEVLDAWKGRHMKYLADWQAIQYDNDDWRSVDARDRRPPVWVR